MKQKLLIFSVLILISSGVIAQVSPGQIDDFEDGTVQSWFESGLSPNPPLNIDSDGPAGVDDNYMQDASTGVGTAGSRVVVRNVTQWAGDYTSQGIIAIRFDARVLTNNLEFRVAMNGDGGSISTSNSVPVAAGSGWTPVVIPISASDMETVTSNVGPGFDVDLTLGNCTEIRIISSLIPAFAGDKIDAIMELDNIEALTTLSVMDIELNTDFRIYPNPSNTILRVSILELSPNLKMGVYDILGKQILQRKINDFSTVVNVSSWNAGVYLVTISNDLFTQTKRFIKQ